MNLQPHSLAFAPVDLALPADTDIETNIPLSDGPVPAATPSILTTRETLKEALRVCELLNSKTSIVGVVTSITDVHALGIGHLIHNGLRKKFCQDIPPGEIIDRVLREEISANPETPISRHRFIIRMRQLGLVENGVNNRQIKPAGTTPCLKSLSALISERARLPFDEITSQSRRKNVVRARFQAIWVMRVVCGHSLSSIGQCMGNRDHTTVLNSINKVSLMIEADAAFRREMDTLCENADAIGVIQNRNLLLRSIHHH